MPLQTLPAAPAPDTNIKRSRKPNLKIAKFGDGYSQRTTFGLNQVATELKLTYTNITENEKIDLEEFITDHDRGQAFEYTLPDEPDPRQWHIVSWDVTYVKFGIFNVEINLEENFDIA